MTGRRLALCVLCSRPWQRLLAGCDSVVLRALFWWLRRSRPLEPMELPSNVRQRVAVLAPHADDEVIGPGGTLLRHVKHGHVTQVIYLTDGRRSRRAGLLESQLVRARMEEAQSVQGFCGFSGVQFWSERDGALAENTYTVDHLRGWLAEYAPQVLYVPYYLDAHPDHRAASRILARAADGLPLSCEVRAYEGLYPLTHLVASHYSDISEEVRRKLQLLAIYRSQRVPSEQVLRWNRLLGCWAGGRTLAAEVFLVAPLAEYCRRVQVMSQADGVSCSVELWAISALFGAAPAYLRNMRSRACLSDAHGQAACSWPVVPSSTIRSG